MVYSTLQVRPKASLGAYALRRDTAEATTAPLEKMSRVGCVCPENSRSASCSSRGEGPKDEAKAWATPSIRARSPLMPEEDPLEVTMNNKNNYINNIRKINSAAQIV